MFEDLKKWALPKESSLALMSARLEASSGRSEQTAIPENLLGVIFRQAEAIKLLDGLINSDKAPAQKEVFEFKIECMTALGWNHWAHYEQTHLAINFPKKFALT